MDAIEALKSLNWFEIFIGLVILVLAGQFLYKTFIEDILYKHGWESAKMRQRREDHELLKATTELAATTAKNLDKLQTRHNHDEEEFRNNLNNYMEESRRDRKALHEEMSRFSEARVHDREQSFKIQKELTDSIKTVADNQQVRNKQIEALMCGSKELLGDTIDQRYSKYIALDGIPENEVAEFEEIYNAYSGLNGNGTRKAKYFYVKDHLKVIPVETTLVK